MNRRCLSRRDVLRIVGIVSLTSALGCDDKRTRREPGNSHAAFVVEPDAHSFIVVAWAQHARKAALEVQTGNAIVYSTVIDVARTAAIEVSGLAASTSYRVTVSFDSGARVGPCCVRTAPRADDPRPIRIAVSADVDPSPEFD